MAGANIIYASQARLNRRYLKSMGYRSIGHPHRGVGKKRLAYKLNAAAPSDSDTADEPNQRYDKVIHYLATDGSFNGTYANATNDAANDHVYRAVGLNAN